jgi:hypothetical protein
MHTHVRGELSSAKTYVPHTFEVPQGARRLSIRFDYSPLHVGEVRNLLCLSLFGPGGFHGAGHRHRLEHPHAVEVGEHWATPGYLAGALEPGLWQLEIDAHTIYGDEPCTYELDIATSAEALTAPVRPRARRFELERLPDLPPGWLRGDLHAHSVHSDAKWTVAELLGAAEALGLDFVTLTDHNTVSGLAELISEHLVTIPGMELTTFWGHALDLGTRAWRDWRTGPNRTMAQVAEEVQAAGQLFVIAHPKAPGDPVCSGCRWLYPEVMPGPARLVEVWNGGRDASANEAALELWHTWLNGGHRVFATAGTDAHSAKAYGSGSGFNVVFAERTAEDILSAIAAGRSYLSCGPHLELTAASEDGENGKVMPGGTARGDPVKIRIQWSGADAGQQLRFIVNGEVYQMWAVEPAGEREIEQGTSGWCGLELRDGSGGMVAVTNPIFLEGDRKSKS